MESSRSRTPAYPPAPRLRTVELPSSYYESPSLMSAGVGAFGTPSRSLMTPPSPSSSSTSSHSSRKATSSSHREKSPSKRLSPRDMPSTPSSHSSSSRSYHQSSHSQTDYYSPAEKGYYSPDFQSRRYSPQATSPSEPSYPNYPPYAPCTPYKPLPSVSGHYPLTPPYESRPLPSST